MLAVAWRDAWRKPALLFRGRLQERGLSQVFPDNQTLERFLVNLVGCCGLLLAAAIALLICARSTVIMISTGLTLAAAATASIYALGIFLHATRLLAIRAVQEKYRRLWSGEDDVHDPAERGEDDVHDPAEHHVREIDQRAWNQIVLGEILMESLPSMTLNMFNMRAMQGNLNQPMTYPAMISIGVSALAIARHLYRFVYWMCVRGRSLADVPADPASIREVAFAGASHAAEVGEAAAAPVGPAAVRIGVSLPGA
jgi:hypothetical protein